MRQKWLTNIPELGLSVACLLFSSLGAAPNVMAQSSGQLSSSSDQWNAIRNEVLLAQSSVTTQQALSKSGASNSKSAEYSMKNPHSRNDSHSSSSKIPGKRKSSKKALLGKTPTLPRKGTKAHASKSQAKKEPVLISKDELEESKHDHFRLPNGVYGFALSQVWANELAPGYQVAAILCGRERSRILVVASASFPEAVGEVCTYDDSFILGEGSLTNIRCLRSPGSVLQVNQSACKLLECKSEDELQQVIVLATEYQRRHPISLKRLSVQAITIEEIQTLLSK